MRIDQSGLAMQSAWSTQSTQHFSGTYQTDASALGTGTSGAAAGSALDGGAGSSHVQISDQGRKAAASDGTSATDANSQIGAQMDAFKGLMEKMLGVSISSMNFDGDVSESESSGASVNAVAGRNGYAAQATTYASSSYQLAAQGTLTTADGRTFEFSAALSLSVSLQTTAGISNSYGNTYDNGADASSSSLPQSTDSGAWQNTQAANSQAASPDYSKAKVTHSDLDVLQSLLQNDSDQNKAAVKSHHGPFTALFDDPLLQQLSVWLKGYSGGASAQSSTSSSAAAPATAAASPSDAASDAQKDSTAPNAVSSRYMKLDDNQGGARTLNVAI
ncbi:hypothetical protein JCM19000A_12300 [Silvimonas sp. JCM 19000]